MSVFLRRTALCLSLAAGFAVVSLGAGARLSDPGDMLFTVLRQDDPIGTHRIAFERQGDEFHVRVDIDLEVKLAFVTLFRYSHSNHEIWRDNRLVSLETSTDYNGKPFFVRGRASAEGFAVESSSGSYVTTAEVLPSSYWHPETVGRERLINTQSGKLMSVTVKPLGAESVQVGDNARNSRRYRVEGDLKADLWYTPEGEWTKLVFEINGETIVYDKQQLSGVPVVSSTNQDSAG
jgi:hypothetical protein